MTKTADEGSKRNEDHTIGNWRKEDDHYVLAEF